MATIPYYRSFNSNEIANYVNSIPDTNQGILTLLEWCLCHNSTHQQPFHPWPFRFTQQEVMVNFIQLILVYTFMIGFAYRIARWQYLLPE